MALSGAQAKKENGKKPAPAAADKAAPAADGQQQADGDAKQADGGGDKK